MRVCDLTSEVLEIGGEEWVEGVGRVMVVVLIFMGCLDLEDEVWRERGGGGGHSIACH